MKPHSVPAPSRSGGFTLIEVTLAIGITSIALIALLAMVPQGLMTMKLATDRAIEARIHQQIHAEVSLAEWDERTSFDNTVRFYDDQGIEIERGSSGSVREEVVYAARINVPASGSSLPDRLGGSYQALDFSPSQTDNNEVQLVLVEVSTSPNVREAADFDREENWGAINTYQSTMTRFIDNESLSN